MLVPGQPAPALVLDTPSGEAFELSEQRPDAFSLVLFYRGLHCPVCHTYLKSLVALGDDFATLGVDAVAVSMDDRTRCVAMIDSVYGNQESDAGQPGDGWLNWTFGLTARAARDWGLLLSESIGKTSIDIEESAVFAEPGLFLVRPDGTLYFAAIQSAPFARPPLEQLRDAIRFVTSRDYPARGTYAGDL